MLQELKAEIKTVVEAQGGVFVSKDVAEYEDYAQRYDFAAPSVNLVPLQRYTSNKRQSGAIGFNADFEIHFLTKFNKSVENEEDVKDALIDQLIVFAEDTFRRLDRNQNQTFIQPRWTWRNEIVRQYTSNLLCGVKAFITLDTACNRI